MKNEAAPPGEADRREPAACPVLAPCEPRRAINPEKPTLASEIVMYLRAHPAAQDTVDGIAQWWISRQRVTALTAEVEAAVAELTRQGILERVSRPDGQVSYRASSRPKRPGKASGASTRPRPSRPPRRSSPRQERGA